MSDELDPLLLELFEARRAPLDDPQFVAALLADMDRHRRSAGRRLAVYGVALLGLLAWQLPTLLRATAAAVQTVSVESQAYAPLMLSPIGWAVSMAVGLLVMLRILPRRL